LGVTREGNHTKLSARLDRQLNRIIIAFAKLLRNQQLVPSDTIYHRVNRSPPTLDDLAARTKFKNLFWLNYRIRKGWHDTDKCPHPFTARMFVFLALLSLGTRPEAKRYSALGPKCLYFSGKLLRIFR